MSRIQPAFRVFFPVFVAILLALSAGPACAEAPAATPAPSAKRLAEQAFSRGTPLPAWVSRIDTLPPAVPGVSLSARLSDVQFYVGATSTLYAHRALVAGDASSLGALGQYEVQFQPEYQQVALHSLRILRGGTVIDKLASADIRFLQRETSFDQGIYSGEVTAAIVTEDVRVGDTLEMEYTITGQNPVFGGKFFHAAQWDSPMQVQLRRVTLNMPAGRKIHYRLIGGERGAPPAISDDVAGDRHVVRFQAMNLPQTIAEPYVPDDVHAYRFLQFSEFDNWRDVNQWALGLFATGASSPAMTAALAPARAAPTRQQAVAKVLEFVQNEIRYLSISLGENSHRPFPPEQVLQRRYGDCKDKSLLMVSMLRELGIDAAPVLVSTVQRKGIESMLPSPLLFDHAIVRAIVDGKIYFFDPTRQGQYGALDRMGQTHAGSQGLVIDRSNPGLNTIAAPANAGQVQSHRLERVTVEAVDKPVEMLVRRTYSGVSAEYLRLQLAGISKERLHKAYDGVLGDRYPESSMLGEPVIQDDRAQNSIVVESRYRISNFFEAMADGWQLRYVPANMTEAFYVPGNASRQFPLVVPNFPSTLGYELELVLPDTFDGNYKDSTNDYRFAPFNVAETFSFTGRRAAAKVSLQIKADRVAHDGVVEYLASIKKYNSVLNGSFFIRKSDLKSQKAAVATVAAPRVLTPKEQLEANLTSTTRLIGDAELVGQDASDALCERAMAFAYLGNETEARKDAERALQLRSQSGDMWKCRADINFVFGKFKDSEADFGKAIARGSSGLQAHLGKGLNSFFLGKVASAKVDLGHARERAADQSIRRQMDIWLAIVDWQAVKAPAPEAGELAADKPGQAWRLAALNMFARDAEPDQMLRLASQDGGNGMDQRLTEAYFYAGKYYQLKQDTVRARVYFRQSIGKGMLGNVYYVAARHELARTPN
jgi:lipoprotein NlpI